MRAWPCVWPCVGACRLSGLSVGFGDRSVWRRLFVGIRGVEANTQCGLGHLTRKGDRIGF